MIVPAGTDERPAPIGRWALLVALGFLLIHGTSLARRYAPNTWLFADGSFYFATVRSIAEHGQLEQRGLHPTSWYEQDLGWNRRLGDDWSNVSLGQDGGWYPKHPILLPLLSVIPYLVWGPPGTLLTNALLNLAFVLLVFLLARRVTRPIAAAAVALGVAAMPFVVDMSYTFSNDLLGAVLLLGSLESALASREGLAGVLAGFALWSRVTNVAFLPALVVAGFATGGRRAVTRAVLFSLIPLSLYASLNTWLFGAPWITSYHRVIVREAGAMTTAAHTRLFNVELLAGLRRIVTAPDGAFRSFPPLAPGIIGAFVLSRRHRSLALSVVLFTLMPVLTYAKYDWYRPHFLYPSFGVAAALGLAGLLGLGLPPIPTQQPVTLTRGLLVGLVCLAVPMFLLRPPPADRSRLSAHLREARVQLDEIPCDYFNIQNERWECSHFDPGGWAMTGLVRSETVNVRGVRWDGLWMHPNPTGRWRRISWSRLEGSAIELTFALADPTRPGPVQVEVRARGQETASFTLSTPGEEHRLTVPIAAGEGDALEIRTRAEAPHWKQLVFEGRLVP